MRTLLYVLSALAVMGLAFWAYRQNYATQKSLKEVAALQRQIADLHDALGMQQAEWAYENRPSRLRDLTIVNFGKLPLLPMTPEQFARVADLPMPQPAPDPATTAAAAAAPTAVPPVVPPAAPPTKKGQTP